MRPLAFNPVVERPGSSGDEGGDDVDPRNHFRPVGRQKEGAAACVERDEYDAGKEGERDQLDQWTFLSRLDLQCRGDATAVTVPSQLVGLELLGHKFTRRGALHRIASYTPP